MLLLSKAVPTTPAHNDVLMHAVDNAARYDITPVAHSYFAAKQSARDIRRFGSLVPPDGDTYFEFTMPTHLELGRKLLLDKDTIRGVGVLAQHHDRSEITAFESLTAKLPWWAQRRAHAKTQHLLELTFLFEHLDGGILTVFYPIMKHYYLLGNDGLPVVRIFVQKFSNVLPAVTTLTRRTSPHARSSSLYSRPSVFFVRDGLR